MPTYLTAAGQAPLHRLWLGLFPLVLLSAAASAEAPPPATPVPATTTASGPLTIDEAVEEAQEWSESLSPNGRYVALIQKQQTKALVHIIDRQAPDKISRVALPDDAQARWVAWANDDRLLVSIVQWVDAKGQTIPIEQLKKAGFGIPFRHLLAMDRQGQNPVVLLKDVMGINVATVNNFLRKDPQHIIMQARDDGGPIDLYKVDVDTGTNVRIAHGNDRTLAWFTDISGAPAFRLDKSWTGSAVNVFAPDGADRDGTIKWKKIVSISLRDEQHDAAPDFYPLLPGPDPGTYYVAARKDGADTTGIYLYDLFKNEYIRLISQKPGIDVENMLTESVSHAYFATSYYADRLQIEFADPKLQAHLKGLDRFFGEEADINLADRDSNGDVWLLYASGPRDRGSYYSYDLKTHAVDPIGSTYPFLDPDRLGATEIIRYRTRDDRTIMGYLTRPPGAKPGTPSPVIVMPHGGPERRDRYSFNALVQLLATRGYTIFQPNFRGSSGFGKAFADSGHGEWGGAMQNDLDDGFAYLVSIGVADAKNACIVGGSYGGYAALVAATQTPNLYRCVVSIAGVSNLEDLLKADRRKFSDLPEAWEYMVKQIGDLKKDKARIEDRSPIHHVDTVTAPILLIHGKRDDIVPFDQSKEMDKALRKAGKSVRFIPDDDAGHHWNTEEQERKLDRAVLDFLAEQMPTPLNNRTSPASAGTTAQAVEKTGS